MLQPSLIRMNKMEEGRMEKVEGGIIEFERVGKRKSLHGWSHITK